jgi:PAS domain S-box-containing protein
VNLAFWKERLFPRRSGNDHGQGAQQSGIGSSEIENALRREALLGKITSAVHSSLDVDQVLQSIVNELGLALEACRCRLATFPEQPAGWLPITHFYAAQCCVGRPGAFERIPTESPFLQELLRSDSPVAVDDVYEEPRLTEARKRFKAAGIKSMLSVAIKVDGRPFGVLYLQHCEQKHQWRDWEVSLVRTAAKQAGVAFRQAELYREVRDSATRSALVSQIITSIRRSLDLNETLQVAVEEIGRALNANRTCFRKLSGDEFVAVAEYLSDPSLSQKEVAFGRNDYIATYLKKSRRTLVMDDVEAFLAGHPEIAAEAVTWRVPPLTLSEVVCPIIVGGLFWGTLSIAQTDHKRNWTAAEVALIEIVTAQIEVAVSHSNLYLETKQAADRQGLISHIIHGVNQSNKLDEIFPIIASELGDHLSVDRLAISKLSPCGTKWVVAYVYKDGKVTTPHLIIDAADFTAFPGFTAGDVMRCDDVEKDRRIPEYYREKYMRPMGTRSFIAVRLRHGGKTRLVISAVMTSGPRRWTDEEVEVIRAAVDQVFVSLQRAELFEQVLQSKHQWEATFDALTDGILMFDRDGVLVRINQAGAAFEAAEARDLLGRRCCTLMQGAENEACRVAQVIETGRPVTFELVPGRLGRPVLVTISPLWDDHQVPPSNTDSSAPEREAGPAPNGAVCVVRDLSELRAAEATAREQRNFLVKLIENANDAIFAFSREGHLIWFNEQLVTLTGYSRVELSFADYRTFVAGDDKKLAVARFNQAAIGEPQTFEAPVIRKDGEQRILMMTLSPVYDEGGVTSVLTIARDVTEDRLAADRSAQADKLRALGQLASGVAHNFNNVLAAIVGHSQLLRRDCNDEAMCRRIDIIERAAMDGAETVKRIQAFGLQQNEAVGETVDMSQLVRDSTELTRARWSDEAQARGLQYEVELNLKDVPLVKGSASELREVFVNIILNALDAMPQGGKIRISTDTYGPNVRAVFTDTGLGMTREVTEHIFEPFFTTKGVLGMGLGLAVSYSILERHRGRIEVASAPGRGTTFTITIPRAEAPKHRLPKRKAAAKTSVLVINHEEDVRDNLLGILGSAGIQAEWATSAREGLAKMELGRFDLVFTDLSLPEMDGWTLATEINRGWPSVKIVLVTGYGVPPETVRHYRELVHEVVFKPIRREAITAALTTVLN